MNDRWRQFGLGATLAIASGCMINGKPLLPGFGGKGGKGATSAAGGKVAAGAGSEAASGGEAAEAGSVCADIERAAPVDQLALKVFASWRFYPENQAPAECYDFPPDYAELVRAFDNPGADPVGRAALLMACGGGLGCIYSAAHFDAAALAAAAKDKKYTPRERELISAAGQRLAATIAKLPDQVFDRGDARWNRKILIDGRAGAAAAWDAAYQPYRDDLDFVFATYQAMAARPTDDHACRDEAVERLLARLGSSPAGAPTAVVPTLDVPVIHGLMVTAMQCAVAADDAPLYATLDKIHPILVDRLQNTKVVIADRWSLHGPDAVAARAMHAAIVAAKANGKDLGDDVDPAAARPVLESIRLPGDQYVVGANINGTRAGTIAKLTDDGDHVIVTFKKRTKKEVAAVNCVDGRVTGIDGNGNLEHESRCDFKEYTVDLTTRPTRIGKRFAAGLRKGDWVYFATIEPMDVVAREAGTQFDGLPVIGFAATDEKKVVSLLGARLR